MILNRTLLARQPIYSQDLKVAAYELVFRPMSEDTVLQHWDADQATTHVILHAFGDTGLQNISENKPTYINFNMSWLEQAPPFPPEQIIIEIKTPQTLPSQILETLQTLKSKHYRIGLDNFIYHDRLEPLLPLVDTIKIDTLRSSQQQLMNSLAVLHNKSIIKVAKCIETHQQLEQAIELGFDLYQGFFLCRPQSIKGKALAPNRIVVIDLLNKLQDPQVEIDELEQIITRDPTLSLKLVKVINSAQYARGCTIDSIQQIIVLLGLEKLRAWSSVIALSQLSDKPSALLATAMLRARMCELLAEHAQLTPRNMYFTIGLFSTLDAFFDQSLLEILNQLPLTSDFIKALITHEGNAGLLLQSTIRHECAEWDDINWAGLKDLNITPATIESTYLEAIQWSADVCQSTLN